MHMVSDMRLNRATRELVASFVVLISASLQRQTHTESKDEQESAQQPLSLVQKQKTTWS